MKWTMCKNLCREHPNHCFLRHALSDAEELGKAIVVHIESCKPFDEYLSWQERFS